MHFDQVAFGDLLVVCDEAFTEGATDFEDVAASEFFVMGVFVDFHTGASLLTRGHNKPQAGTHQGGKCLKINLVV